jgi:glucose/arabinose dehydrogenase
MVTVVLMLAASACRGDSRATEVHPVQPAPAPVQSAAGSAAPVVAAPAAPPPGTDKLGSPPTDVAGKITLKQVARGLSRPVLFVVAPDDARKRWFVVEQRGAIVIFEGGKQLKKPFFTIKDLSTGNEQGLLGLAFHPKFAETGKLYINYTSRDAATHIVE